RARRAADRVGAPCRRGRRSGRRGCGATRRPHGRPAGDPPGAGGACAGRQSRSSETEPGTRSMIRDPETLNALLDSISRFVRERLVPAENEVAETDEISEAIVAEMRELGLFG